MTITPSFAAATNSAGSRAPCAGEYGGVQGSLEDFSGRALGQVRGERDQVGHLVGREPFLGPGAKLVTLHRAAGAQHDYGADLFPVVLVGDGDDGDFEDVRVLAEDRLDLAG